MAHQLDIGTPGTFHMPDGSTHRATVDWQRGGELYDLVVEGVDFGETQMVPNAAQHGLSERYFVPYAIVVPETADPVAPAPGIRVLNLRQPPAWPAYAALALSVVGAGLAVLSLALR